MSRHTVVVMVIVGCSSGCASLHSSGAIIRTRTGSFTIDTAHIAPEAGRFVEVRVRETRIEVTGGLGPDPYYQNEFYNWHLELDCLDRSVRVRKTNQRPLEQRLLSRSLALRKLGRIQLVYEVTGNPVKSPPPPPFLESIDRGPWFRGRVRQALFAFACEGSGLVEPDSAIVRPD